MHHIEEKLENADQATQEERQKLFLDEKEVDQLKKDRETISEKLGVLEAIQIQYDGKASKSRISQR